MALSAIGLFCEDVREEQAGTFSIIGVFPDNLKIPPLPGMLAKLGFFLRVQTDVPEELQPMTVWLQPPNQKASQIGEFDTALIEKTRQDTTKLQGPFFGLIFRGLVSPFSVESYGRIQLIVRIDDREIVAASLNCLPTEQ